MECIMITKDTPVAEAHRLAEEATIGVPIEELPRKFCQTHLFRSPKLLFLDNGSLRLNIAIQEEWTVLGRLHQFAFFWSVANGKTDRLTDVTYGVLSP